MSHPRRIMVSSRKHHRSVLRYRPDRGRDHVVGADPSQGMAGRVREPRRWRLGVGPSEGSGPAMLSFGHVFFGGSVGAHPVGSASAIVRCWLDGCRPG